jgi:two-component system, LytTR family, sensor histidine kinase AlgZ
MPLASSGVARVLGASALAAITAGGIWIALTQVWLSFLQSLPSFAASADLLDQQTPLLFSAAVLVFLLVLSVHYVVLAFEAVCEAERQQLELQVLTREAELRALRAQVDPHFLYNSLNSISALTTADPQGARRMCLLLGDFMRNTLKVSALNRIPMADELALADGFLSIEQVRFGARLQVERAVDERAMTCRVPPLLLQPLVENAVKHGIAGLVDGGFIRLEADCHDGVLRLKIENEFDPDSPASSRHGLGLRNVRGRLRVLYENRARIDTSSTGDRFVVEMELPCTQHLQ